MSEFVKKNLKIAEGDLLFIPHIDFFLQQTCMDAVDKFLDKYSVILIGVAIGIACLEVSSAETRS